MYTSPFWAYFFPRDMGKAAPCSKLPPQSITAMDEALRLMGPNPSRPMRTRERLSRRVVRATVLVKGLAAQPGVNWAAFQSQSPVWMVPTVGLAPSARLAWAMARPWTRAAAQRGLSGSVALFRGKRSEEHTSELQSRLHLVCR